MRAGVYLPLAHLLNFVLIRFWPKSNDACGRMPAIPIAFQADYLLILPISMNAMPGHSVNKLVWKARQPHKHPFGLASMTYHSTIQYEWLALPFLQAGFLLTSQPVNHIRLHDHQTRMT